MVNTTDIPQLLITVQEASQAISISAKTVRNFIRTGRLSSVNLHGIGIRNGGLCAGQLLLYSGDDRGTGQIPWNVNTYMEK